VKFHSSHSVFPVIEISGGLGNQLFQYAFARKLRQDVGIAPVLSLLGYKRMKHQQRRDVEIHSFLNSEFQYFPGKNIGRGLTSFCENLQVKNAWNTNNQLLQTISETSPFNAQNIDKASNGLYKSSLISLHYWEDIFDQTIAIIYGAIATKCAIPDGNHPLPNEDVLGIHIRRGDYISNPKTRNFHGFCSEQYYLDAAEIMLSNRANIRSILVFTDDQASCLPIIRRMQEFGLPVSFNQASNPVLGLFEMGLCGQLIGSNSTYSWWAAHTGIRKVSIFPANWFVGITNYDIEGFFKVEVELLQHKLATQ
jgi:hypothetical protein